MSGSGPWPGGVGGISTSLLWPYSRGGGGYVLYSRTPLFHCVPVLLLHCNSLGGGGELGSAAGGRSPLFLQAMALH